MANRSLLHKSHLERFREWLDTELIGWREGKGDYQVMQVMTEVGWKCVYSRLDMPEHYTLDDKLVPLAKRFVAAYQHQRSMGKLYEELRKEIDGGSESTTHTDAIESILYWKRLEEAVQRAGFRYVDGELKG